MKLITHNLLRSNVKGVKTGYPLGIDATEVEQEDTEYCREFLVNMLPKIDVAALSAAAKQLGYNEVPTEAPDAAEEDDAFLMKIHHALFNLNVITGNLICPETGREFPVTKGIPNMLLREDEL
eukprot:TRINITY_DN946_c0_g1_i2.p1 TRINITY_DN946_c0_g1~~TRINITY_DN946_c0_g1_i2.p1  ORF type:complete len:123 (-),score=30.68 TRINITY_DN946_c0_g1_i2:150-518(-)